MAKPFLEWVASSRFNTPGRLFVIVGRATLSAGLYAAAWMVQNTRAIVVGEPVGDHLDYWSEGGNIELPFSGLTLHFANGFHGYSKRPYPDLDPHEPVVAGGVRLVHEGAQRIARRGPEHAGSGHAETRDGST